MKASESRKGLLLALIVLERFVRLALGSVFFLREKPKMELALSWMITLAKAKINVNLCCWVWAAIR
jgi:hypothetical protein